MINQSLVGSPLIHFQPVHYRLTLRFHNGYGISLTFSNRLDAARELWRQARLYNSSVYVVDVDMTAYGAKMFEFRSNLMAGYTWAHYDLEKFQLSKGFATIQAVL